MGRYGQAILTIAGTIVGAYFGYPALGAVLGGLAGNLLFPTVLPTVQGPRLSDISQTTSNVGAPIPRGWGTFPATGCIIAQTDLREVIESEEVGGKGGSSQTVETPTYYQDFAIGLNGSNIYGKGEIAGVRTAWANGKAIYDRRPRREEESDSDFQKRMIASDQLEGQFTLYLGTETQLPDPTLEAFYGVGNISAFRGLAYIVFHNWLNKAEDGNRMPGQWKFEVYTDGALDVTESTEFSNERLFDWVPAAFPIAQHNRNVYTAVGFSSAGPTESLNDLLTEAKAARNWADAFYLGAINHTGHGDGVVNTLGGTGFDNQTSIEALLYYGIEAPDIYVSHAEIIAVPSVCSRAAPTTTVGQVTFDESNGVSRTTSISGLNNTPLPSPPFAPYSLDPSGNATRCAQEGAYWWSYAPPVYIEVSRYPGPPLDPCEGQEDIPILPGYCISGFNQLARRGPWVLDDSQDYLALQRFHGDVAFPLLENITRYPLNPVRPVGHSDNTEEFWTTAYEAAVLRGEMSPGRSYSASGTGSEFTTYPHLQTFGYRRDFQSATISTSGVSMATIVSEICLEAGYDPTDFDVTDLEDVEIIGYVRTRQMAARAALEPLRTVGFWDLTEIQGVLTFIRRGGPISKTLTEDDLAAYPADAEIPSKVTTRLLQDMELPRQIRLHYIAPSRDYEAGEQPSPVRVECESDNDQDVEVAVVMTDAHAAQVAEIIHADAWHSRWVHEIAVDTSMLGIVPTDVLGVPIDGRIERSRVVAATDSLPSLRKMELNRDDDGNYVSTAVGSSPPYQPGTPTVVGVSELLLLDLPLLRDQDNDAGFYAAMRPYFGSESAGLAIYRSVDGGGTYTRIGQIGGAGVIGLVLTPLASGPHTVWDNLNELIIEMDSGEPENRTAAAVLAGANAFAVGADGRWEVGQFTTAENLVENVWRLTGLLRGRRGTEHFIGTGVAGDRFVLLSTAGSNVARVSLPISGVRREYLYKGVPAGGSLGTTDAQAFTGYGVALKPFSPVFVTGARDSITGAWTVEWTRRGRIGETLQSGIDVPLSEDFEDYEVDIIQGTEVVRTISVSTEQAVYEPAQQIADFGALQTELSIVVYQISAQVGRGTGTEATL